MASNRFFLIITCVFLTVFFLGCTGGQKKIQSLGGPCKENTDCEENLICSEKQICSQPIDIKPAIPATTESVDEKPEETKKTTEEDDKPVDVASTPSEEEKKEQPTPEPVITEMTDPTEGLTPTKIVRGGLTILGLKFDAAAKEITLLVKNDKKDPIQFVPDQLMVCTLNAEQECIEPSKKVTKPCLVKYLAGGDQAATGEKVVLYGCGSDLLPDAATGDTVQIQILPSYTVNGNPVFTMPLNLDIVAS